MALLDIIETAVGNLIGDVRKEVKNNESEMTSYRKTAMILDLIFKDTSIDLME